MRHMLGGMGRIINWVGREGDGMGQALDKGGLSGVCS